MFAFRVAVPKYYEGIKNSTTKSLEENTQIEQKLQAQLKEINDALEALKSKKDNLEKQQNIVKEKETRIAELNKENQKIQDEIKVLTEEISKEQKTLISKKVEVKKNRRRNKNKKL
ncbi:hypothetical protein [Mycoplasma leachii]|uniref:hypothetical protein n=1 Tax=Mycoplasma leachii TaxID=2105 RepID=UPI003DA69B23